MQQDKPLAQKLDERVFEQLLKYNPNTQNLWDIVGLFENERQKLRLEVAQYHQDIKDSQSTLKALRAEITAAKQTLHSLEQQLRDAQQIPENEEHTQMLQKMTELELENSKLRVELRDLRSEFELEENLQQFEAKSHSNKQTK
ncbi:hypothetical protein [Helicobacter cinaedi]|uniref:hypothetical protein n=1 Tax=Helicobacter cinaedi TaxID=213 RepID=UPI000CF132F2|nr:hypothetical protein [Helicobacter cinaedi]